MRTLVLALIGLMLVQSSQAQPASNKELAALYEADQADRKDPAAIDWNVVGPRDRARQAITLRIMKEGGLRTAEDFHNAALIFQHGSSAEDIQLAYSLATLSVTLSPEDKAMRWLQAAAWDRNLMRQGKPQWYGTQYQFNSATQRTELYKVDESAVTDAQREAAGVPSLAQAKEREAMFNR